MNELVLNDCFVPFDRLLHGTHAEDALNIVKSGKLLAKPVQDTSQLASKGKLCFLFDLFI